jgi:DNA (cytosine-5)-methyltransferase 1
MPCIAVDLFCGIGGLTHGLALSGLQVSAGFDIDATCRYAYEANNDSVFVEADIANLMADDIINYYPEGSTKILVGCAPCQPFSKYTQRYRKTGQSGNKWRLLDSFARLIHEIRPEIVSMENVPELATQSVFRDFVNTLEGEGYHVQWQVVYCPDYGVSQSRRRLVLLASLLGEIQLIPPQFEPNAYLTVQDIIGDLPPINAGQADNNDPLHCSSQLSETNLTRITNSVPGGTWREWDEGLQLDCHKRDSGKTYPSVYGRMLWNEPAPTITTQFYGYGNGRFGHPEQNRALSIREGAMLQSFTANYRFVEPDGKVIKRELGIHIGNAVPVNLGRAIGVSIQNHIREVGIDA